MTQRIEISNSTMLKPGDIIELEYKFVGPDWTIWKSILLAGIDAKLKKTDTFWIKSYRLESSTIIFRVQILEQPQYTETQQAGIISTAAVITACTAIIGGLLWFILDKTYQIIETPAGKVLGTGIGALGIAAAIGVVVYIFRGFKK